MKQYILSSILFCFLTISSLTAADYQVPSTSDICDEQLYRSLVYINKDARESIVVLNHLLPEYPWSTTCKKVCLYIQDEVNVMPCKDVACVVDECLEACKDFPHEKIETIQTQLTQYKEILHTGKAHVCNWKNDDDAHKIVTRNCCDGSRENLYLFTRNLTVDGTETVNGLLTVNGIIALNGRLILNGIDINTVIANAAAAAAASSGIQTIQGDSGSVTGTTVTLAGGGASGAGASISFVGAGTNMSFNTTDANSNTFLGLNSGNSTVSGTRNSAFGATTLSNITSGVANTAINTDALTNLSTGSANNAIGSSALIALSTGSANNAIGSSALIALSTGSFNIGIGSGAGAFYTGAESSNIVLNSLGITGESHTLRIGNATGTAPQQLNRAFISGIRGITTGVADAIPVLIDSANQLGTLSSSKRFKENIIPMPASFSDNLLQLNPTLFNYKQDESKKQTWGLIAEEVQQIFPNLVVKDQEGLPLTVKYHEMPVLLLNELIKLKKENAELEKRVSLLEKN
jgi:hypothetical protein